MWNIADIKAQGRMAFKRNYWPSVIVGLILALVTGGVYAGSSNHVSGTTTELQQEYGITTMGQMTVEQQVVVASVLLGAALVAFAVSLLVKVFISNPVEVGSARFYQKNLYDPTTGVGTLAEGFGDYGRVFVTLLLRDVFTLLWCLLLIVPGIMKSYSYLLVPYIVKDRPELSAREVLELSSQMMAGNRGRAFLMDLSFIGWYLLGALTMGLAMVFWTNPYVYSTHAALYLELKGQRF